MYKKSNFDKFRLYVDEFVCNKFGFAELFTENYFRLEIKPKNALDVGCGVGPLSIFLADKDIYVDAIDINPIATKLCNLNVNKYRLNKYLNIICDDFSAYNFTKKYDLIISNPPIDISRNNIINKNIKEQVKKGCINSDIFSFITNSWKDENYLDLLSHIFIKSRELLTKEGVIILIFGDIDKNNYLYVEDLSKKYGLKIKNHIPKKIDFKKVGLPKEYENILAHIVVLSL